MKYRPELLKGTLIRRYKRFLADVRLDGGEELTIHCPNTGSMKHCAEPGDEVWFQASSNPARKYVHTWELARTRRGHYIGINTGRANELVMSAIEEDLVAEFRGYQKRERERRYGNERSRIDILLSEHVSQPDCYIEIKSVTLLDVPVSSGIGYFPDAISTRGSKHLRELMAVVEQGARGVLCFCVQHSGIREVRPAAHIDPVYSETLIQAAASGVEVIALKARLSPTGLRITGSVPVRIDS